jgi:hypothetical protein
MDEIIRYRDEHPPNRRDPEIERLLELSVRWRGR